ncbi:hypothetical protein KM043_010849 [Ampulex compressa]|nr:hypothetical protein KM043_010849 [Ampulex compressa]
MEPPAGFDTLHSRRTSTLQHVSTGGDRATGTRVQIAPNEMISRLESVGRDEDGKKKDDITKEQPGNSTGFDTMPDRLARTHELTSLNLIQHPTSPTTVLSRGGATREERTS